MKGASVALRPRLLSIVRRVRDAWRGHGAVLVQTPTGTGKARVIVAMVGGVLKSGNGMSPCVWIVALRHELVE